MIDRHCPICSGLGWVCENHPKLAWADEPDGCQCGAGMPCECQGEDGVEDPVILEIICQETRH
jgi:hypothetical protein